MLLIDVTFVYELAPSSGVSNRTDIRKTLQHYSWEWMIDKNGQPISRQQHASEGHTKASILRRFCLSQPLNPKSTNEIVGLS